MVDSNADANKPLSILSIDMGIQNLAFAHLRIPRTGTDPDSPASLPILTAWYRLNVSDLSILNMDDAKSSKSKWQPMWRRKPKPEPEDPDAFAPDRQAVIAYDLISALVNTYRPTHVLIERQRFRTGGGVAVPEWTLRVGVFEGMIHAVVHALSMERGKWMDVENIDPKRVLRYWLGLAGKDSKIVPNSNEVKKAKIDIIGKWISAARDGRSKSPSESVSATGELVPGTFESEKVLLAGRSESIALQEIVDAYIRKWKGSRAYKDASPSSGSLPKKDEVVDIGKLDDLADCLLQGLAWVDWQAMKERIVREGPEALGIKRKRELSSGRRDPIDASQK